jgi:Flp pilus assembly pilin Flp
MKHLLNRVRREEGQDLIEYALVVFLIAIAAVAAVTTVGTTVRDLFWNVIAAGLP